MIRTFLGGTFVSCEFSRPPQTELTFQGGNFSKWLVQYDLRTRNPKWTLEYMKRLDENHNSSGHRKHSKFYAESSIKNEMFKVNPRDYNNTGFDRGHLVPAADFSGNQSDLDSTFCMINISPQNSSLNKGLWAKLESWIRSLLSTDFEEIIIISGPVYAPSYVNGSWVYMQQTIGSFPKLISIPTHFFKVILAKRYEQTSADSIKIEKSYIAAFLIPNSNVDSNSSLLNFTVRVDQLEAIVGILFFDEPVLNSSAKRQVDAWLPRHRDMEVVLSYGNALNSQSRESSKNSKEIVQQSISNMNHLCSVVDCQRPFVKKTK